jgi:hypothetical protein
MARKKNPSSFHSGFLSLLPQSRLLVTGLRGAGGWRRPVGLISGEYSARLTNTMRITRYLSLGHQLVLERVAGNFADCVLAALGNLMLLVMPATCALCALLPLRWCASLVTWNLLRA